MNEPITSEGLIILLVFLFVILPIIIWIAGICDDVSISNATTDISIDNNQEVQVFRYHHRKTSGLNHGLAWDWYKLNVFCRQNVITKKAQIINISFIVVNQMGIKTPYHECIYGGYFHKEIELPLDTVDILDVKVNSVTYTDGTTWINCNKNNVSVDNITKEIKNFQLKYGKSVNKKITKHTSGLQKLIEQHENVLFCFVLSDVEICKTLIQLICDIEKECNDIIIRVIDFNTNEEYFNVFDIKSIPTLLFFKNGETVDSIVGTTTKENIIKTIEKLKL